MLDASRTSLHKTHISSVEAKGGYPRDLSGRLAARLKNCAKEALDSASLPSPEKQDLHGPS